MSDRMLLATFDHPDDLVEATAEVRRQGYQIIDVFSPCAVRRAGDALVPTLDGGDKLANRRGWQTLEFAAVGCSPCV